MSLRYRHSNGTVYEVKRYEDGHHIVIPVDSDENFRRLAKIAHSARMVAQGESQANDVTFKNLEEIE